MKWLLWPWLIILAGCASTDPIVVRTERVEVPVQVPCRAPDIERPKWAIDALPAGAGVFARVKAMGVELEQRRAYEAHLEAAISACK
ncbi:MAG: hypothetical protein AB7U63_12400 [Porticoccaceae bacterium]